MINLLVDGSIHDPRELLFNAPLAPTSPLPPNSPPPVGSPSLTNGAIVNPSSPLPSPNPIRLSANGSSQPRKSSSNPGKHLKIEDRSYFAVSATLEVLLLLLDYMKVIMNLPMLTTDSMSRVIELLKAFNSRTCQVVLGAGAMRSAGLKNITAKHLGEYARNIAPLTCSSCLPALASQSLSIMISLIPYIRETFRRHLSQKQAVMLIEFDKLKRVNSRPPSAIIVNTGLITFSKGLPRTSKRDPCEAHSHYGRSFDCSHSESSGVCYLVPIHREATDGEVYAADTNPTRVTFQAVKWDIPPQHTGANDYMELLVKETVTLHKVLSRYLPPSVVEVSNIMLCRRVQMSS